MAKAELRTTQISLLMLSASAGVRLLLCLPHLGECQRSCRLAFVTTFSIL